MKITMFNVDFGESILISDCKGDNNLLIDYGSETKKNISYIESKLNSMENREALITHFHDDHINGFIELAKGRVQLFKKVYIPNIFSTYNNYDVNKITFVEIEVVLFFLLNYKFNSGKLSLFEFLVAIANSDAELYLLQRGDEFTSVGIEYITLWPNISQIKFIKEYTREGLIKFLDILGKELDNQTNLNDEIKEISVLLSKAFLKRKDSIERIDIKGDIEELSKRIEKLSEKATALNRKGIDKKRRDELNRWIVKLKKNANKVSIVFQNKVSSICSNILMTGDIDRCRLGWILKNTISPTIKVHNRFNVIKAPHHGTKEHFVDNLPITKNILISNGETNKSNRGKISSCYLKYTKNGVLLNCTNTYLNRCEIITSGQACRGRCNLFNKKELNIFLCNVTIHCLKKFFRHKGRVVRREYKRLCNVSDIRGINILNLRCYWKNQCIQKRIVCRKVWRGQ